MTSARPRVALFGTGALATFVGARLARAGAAEVTLVGTWPEALAAITQRGLAVEEPDGSRWAAPARARSLLDEPRPADAVLVLVKATRTGAVSVSAARAAGEDGLLVTLQNGLGNKETLEGAAGPGRVVQGVTVMGATLVAPGVVRGFPGRILLAQQPPAAGRLAALAGLLRGAGLQADVVPDIERHVWRKLAVNCAINPLSALLGLDNGGLLAAPEPLATLRAAAGEVGAVAQAGGTALDPEEAVEAALSVARATASNRSSMLQDLERGAATEIDALNGAVVREGRRRGVATPVNARLLAAVLEREGRTMPAAAVP